MSSASSLEVAAAYAACRAIARREAKNFYYAFRVLPRHKSDAMCAMYAFMRKADDLADDESMTLPQRRAAMADWTAAWHASRTAPTRDPVFLAVRDTQQRFAVSDDLLDQLVAGTTMDLQEHLPGVVEVVHVENLWSGQEDTTVQVYQTFDDLYRYCYLVASVVGLVTIRIFGYTDSRADLLAERTGIAFQLTNILRDIREDAERNRVYLPLSDQAAHGVELKRILGSEKIIESPEVLRLLDQEIRRAQEYYRSADELIPLLAPDSQPAMRVLVDIYRGLLDRIAAEPGAVFRKRVSVPTPVKLAILARGLLASLAARGR